MMNETGLRRVLPEQSFGSGYTFGTPRHPSLIDPILSKRVCFYKSGDAQFNGLRIVINNRTFKTFDALLDSLSKKVPLPFGVRNITTPRGVHAVHTLDELEDGKSYICSDSRKVKPVNLALARKKLVPWYHARPVSSRRRTVQQARFFPGRNIHKQESVLAHTPKTLLVFRNGDPAVKHTVVLHKRTTPTFESILEYISELMQFHVVKLHTADGRRVDGLPGLILCSGTVVAVGREPFRHANYNAQKSPAQTTLPTKRMGPRRLKALKRKKKSQSHTPKSRNFSLSSERYIVNRIHNSIAGSSSDQASHSVELESRHLLESVPETPDTGLGAQEQDSCLPTDDDIEKSFRVNQDGSMTVEMRVRLTIKEEETIHWTTTLARSSVANQLNVTCLPEPMAEQEISSLKSNSLDLESPAASIDTINKDKTHDNNDRDPPSLGNGVFSESNNEEDDSKVQTYMESPRSAPTPGHKQIRKKQASVESIKSVTVEGIQEGMVGSYSYREQTENGAVTEQYCMVKQKSSRPVPKPRRQSSVDANVNVRNVSTFKSAGMTEIQQIESGGEESLDMASSPVRHKSSGKLLSRNLSSDNASEPTNKTQRKTSSQRRRHKTPQSITSTAELEKTLTCTTLMPLDADQSDDSKMTNDLEKSTAQIIPQPLNIANQPEMKPVLEKICYSIKSIRQITQNKRPSCLEKSNSLPDFSSHVASMFGSSSKALLAFLSVMTLKEGLDDINMNELNANNVSCAEALKMIDSLRKCASIDDSHELKVNLSDLQQSASKQLLQSWKGFQDLSDKCKSRSSTPNNSEQEVVAEAGTEKDCGIDEIVDNLDIPKRLKEELTSLSKVKSCSNDEEKIEKVELKDNSNPEISHFSTEDAVNVRDVAQDEKVNVDVSSIIKRFTDINQPKQSSTGSITKDTKDKDSLYEQNGADKCLPAEPIDKQRPEDKQLYSTVFFAKDKGQQGHNGDKSNQEKTQMNGVVSSKKSLEQNRSTSEAEEQDMEGNQLQMHSEENIPENEFTHDEESGSDEEGQHKSRATKDLEQKVLCKQGVSSTCDSDVDDPPSEEEQPEVECKRLKVIIEESLSGNEEEEEEHRDNLPDHTEQTRTYRELKTLIEEAEEEEDHHADETHICDTVGGDPSQFIENQDSYTKNDKSSLIKSDSLAKTYGFNADEDSGNDHSSCEEHVETEQPKVEDKPINNSSYDDEESSSEDEHADMDRYTEESCTEYQEAPAQSKDTKCDKVVEKLKHQSEEIISQSVAEKVTLLEKQVADAHKTTESSAIRRSSLRHAPPEPDVEDSPSELPTSQSAPGSQSAPQSSLSFSYDSSGVITSEPEGNRVRSIRDMFLAKSATDIPHRCLPSTNPSETRAETSASAGYQSQTSSELSSSEDDSARKSITKGFVRRTIERLYGKKDAKPDEEAGERPPSVPKQKKKEHSSLFSPFHISRSKAKSELSYFNSTNALDTLSEATHCVAFSAQVGPEDRVSIDNEQWFLRENTPIRKSVSDPVGINKNSTNSHDEEICEDTEENTPYSLFCTKSELEDKKSSFSRKCSYFSLPHRSDSDAYQDDLSTVSKSSANGDGTVDTNGDSEDTRMWAERNGTLPGVTDFKMKDNKVHPLMEPPPDGEAVVVQPGKGQGVVSRRSQEPDMLDILYNFCGQNCPIL
ncbi:oxygen-regulated protein 1 [Anarrhichthys ocellatus]|uniref:oxygen-regulated protein 1 n=1 Tax=Anarrhichthys ocellatus TaxID=433405 RepID=UPI0012EDBA37|nr:oxygen-regulated protein 1 [Anarrhichthys ocellatus]